MDNTHRIIAYSLTILVSLNLLLETTTAASVTICPAGQYRSSTLRACADCSKCPMNEIVRKPCTRSSDTTCGPFYEFEFFNQGSEDDAGDEDEEEGGNGRYHGAGDFNLFKVVSTDRPAVGGVFGGENGRRVENGEGSVRREQDTVSVNVPYQQTAVNRWRELCYGLIAGITLITLLFIVYVAYTQAQLRTLSAKVKVNAINELKEEPIYCYTQMFTEDSPDGSKSKTTSNIRKAPSIYKASGSRKIHSPGARALSNEYTPHVHGREPVQEADNLLPVIPEGSTTDSDHVRVVYTNQK